MSKFILMIVTAFLVGCNSAQSIITGLTTHDFVITASGAGLLIFWIAYLRAEDKPKEPNV